VVNSRESVIAATVKEYARRAPLGEMSELDRSCYFAIGVFRSSTRERGSTVRPKKRFNRETERERGSTVRPRGGLVYFWACFGCFALLLRPHLFGMVLEPCSEMSLLGLITPDLDDRQKGRSEVRTYLLCPSFFFDLT